MIPTRNTQSDAGVDLTVIKKLLIPSNGIKALETGLAFEVPVGYYADIRERSGFSLNNTLTIKAGVVDADYRGEVKVIMQNSGDYPITVEAGTKIAQVLLLPVPEFTVEEVTELSESERGEKGFGSSDKIQ